MVLTEVEKVMVAEIGGSIVIAEGLLAAMKTKIHML
jgi:hypothetical protein